VRAGTRRDAILHAVGANSDHGLKRTSRDKRNAVMTLLRDPEWVQWSDREIARQCAVSAPMVASVRASLPVTVNSYSGSRAYTTKHGTTATMTVSNIGARPAPTPAPVASVAPEWRQADIEDFVPPSRMPRFPPEHTAPAGQIRYFIAELERRLTVGRRPVIPGT
jgi:hypothetical protein